MKRCRACSSQVADTANNCPNCGSADLEVMAMPQQPYYDQSMMNGGQPQVQPMMNGGYPQAPVNGAQPMMGGYPQDQGQSQKGMTYSVVYMVILGLFLITNIRKLSDGFNVGTLIDVALFESTIVLVAMRKKAGRILAMIQSALQTFNGILIGILAIIGGETIKEVANQILAIDGSGTYIITVFVASSILSIAFGVCSFIYFKKRASMYTK